MSLLSPLLFLIVGRLWIVSPSDSLQATIERAHSADTLLIKKGRHVAAPKPYRDKICGNCAQALKGAAATVGFHIQGKPLVLLGEDPDSTVLETHAGYGILWEQSPGSAIRSLTVTGGVRDPDGNATDAAIVVRDSRLTVEGVHILNNTHRIDSLVVGIGGIFGREGSEIFILHNTIRNNGWDGMALYRGAAAVIADNVIESGRGAGIGITWDASALVYRNRVSGYWKGIGTFGESRAVVRNNAVFDNLGWGIIATGNSFMEASNNVIYHNGNCGFAAWEGTARGVLRNNVISRNGWKKQWVCPGVGVWMNASLDRFPVLFNDVWDNAGGRYEGVKDQTGLNGNISLDPKFSDTLSFRLSSGSPCINAGDTLLIDPDGSRSDLGIYGGPQAR